MQEIRIQAGIYARKTHSEDPGIVLVDFSRSAVFLDDLVGSFGPAPGSLSVPTEGAAVPLTGITTPGWCWIHNQSGDYNLQVGVKDVDSDLFYPMLEFKPGQRLPVPLSPDLFEEYEGSGTGTGAPTNQLWLRFLDPTERTAQIGTAYIGCLEQ